METIQREQLNKWMRDGKPMALVEVLDTPYFRKFHLPGAMNVPLSDDFESNIQKAVPDKAQPVVVYCQDKSCEASPKAARKLDELGYQEVYDYEAGKDDWKSAGLPVEGAVH
jgi:rhodanese-related sulfurtransferase